MSHSSNTPTGRINSIAYSPDSKLLASGSADATIQLREPATGKLLDTLEGHIGDVHAIVFSPNGKTLASAGKDMTIRLWDVEHKATRAILKRHAGEVFTVAFSPDGRTLASAGEDRTIRLWDVDTGQERAVLYGHTQPVRSVAFREDGKALASAGDDGTVRIWDLSTSPGHAIFSTQTETQTVTFSPDSKRIAAGDDKTVRIWDIATGKEQATLKGHARPIGSVAFSTDGRQLVSRDVANNAFVWDVATAELRPGAAVPETAAPAMRSADGHWEARIEGHAIHVVDRTWSPPMLSPRPRPGSPDPAWHAGQAERAETAKLWYAAGFHLGRLADLRPWDAELRLREARAWGQAQQPARAALALMRAVLLDPDTVPKAR